MPQLLKLTQTVPPTNYPISVGLVKSNARINYREDDELIAMHIATATDGAERFMNRAIISQTLVYSMCMTVEANSWPLAPAPIFILPLPVEFILNHMINRDIGLLRDPVQNVSNVALGQWGSSDTVLVQGTDYDVDYTVAPTRIHFLNGNAWEVAPHVTITYTAGYGPDDTTVPPMIKNAILLWATHLYQNRQGTASVPAAIYEMLWPYRLMRFGDT